MYACLCLATLAALLAPMQPPASTAVAQSSAAQVEREDPAVIRRLETIDAHAADILDLTAAFEQRRHTSLLKKPLTSFGRVRVKGATVRWDTTEPSASVLVIDTASLRIFYPEQHILEIYPVASGLARLASTPLPRLKAIREQFFVHECRLSEMDRVPTDETGAAIALLLLPRGDELKKYIREVRVLLDEPAPPAEPGAAKSEENRRQNNREKLPYGVARQVEVTDADGDRTVVVFKEIRTNTGLKDSDLEFAAPEGTRVSRPLEGMGTDRNAQK